MREPCPTSSLFLSRFPSIVSLLYTLLLPQGVPRGLPPNERSRSCLHINMHAIPVATNLRLFKLLKRHHLLIAQSAMVKCARFIQQLAWYSKDRDFIKLIQFQRVRQAFLQALQHRHRRQHLRHLLTNPDGVGAYLTLFLRLDDFVQRSLLDQSHPK